MHPLPLIAMTLAVASCADFLHVRNDYSRVEPITAQTISHRSIPADILKFAHESFVQTAAAAPLTPHAR